MSSDWKETLASAKKIFSGTLLSRISGLGRDITMAWAFGATASVAALMVAFRFAHLLRRFVGEGALQTAFIPQFEKMRQEDPERAEAFFQSLKSTLTIGLTCIILVAIILLSLIQAPEGWEEIIFLTQLLLPSLLFISLYGLNSARMQCDGRFFLPAVAPVLFNLLWILGALSFHSLPAKEAMPLMAGAISTGCFFQWLVTFRIRHSLHRLSLSRLKPFITPFAMAAVGVTATQINSALDPLFARFASTEGPAYLWYAIRLQQLPLALFGIALSSALLPKFSRLEGADQKRLLYTSTISCAFLMLLMTLILLVFGEQLLSLLFERGEFSASSIQSSYLCLAGYAYGLIPSSLVLLIAPSFYARGNYRVPMHASILAMGVNIACNALFIFGLGYGPESVAYATSIAALINCGYLILKK